jgi:hypothetical protein
MEEDIEMARTKSKHKLLQNKRRSKLKRKVKRAKRARRRAGHG